MVLESLIGIRESCSNLCSSTEYSSGDQSDAKSKVAVVHFASVPGSSLDIIFALVKQLESTLVGLKQVRMYVGTGLGRKMLDVLIEEAETRLTETKKKIIQCVA